MFCNCVKYTETKESKRKEMILNNIMIIQQYIICVIISNEYRFHELSKTQA